MVEVTYICKRTVVSAKPVRPGKLYPLSVLDRLMDKNLLRIVHYFRTPPEATGEPGEITKKLRESISEMLTCYPVVTGRLLKDEEGSWMIKCNDGGVRMVEARAKGSVEEWLRSVDRERELKLVHWEEMRHKPYFWSTFYVQLTEFEEGGLAIGLSCIHLLADLICATKFIKAWADITFLGKMHIPPLFHPLPARRPCNKTPNHDPPKNIINCYKSTLDKLNLVTDTKFTTISLQFTDHMVRACTDMARTGFTPDQTSPVPFEALSGLIWVCLSRIKGKTDGLVDMSIGLDVRKVLGLDKGFFGNCMIYSKVQVAEFCNKHNLSNAAKAIGEVVTRIDKEGVHDLIQWLKCNSCQSPLDSMNACDLICVNLEGVEPYQAVFEEGFSPIRVSYYVEPLNGVGQVLVLPSPPGEGPLSRVVMVALPEDEAVRLCEDYLIKHFSPTVLMGSIEKEQETKKAFD